MCYVTTTRVRHGQNADISTRGHERRQTYKAVAYHANHRRREAFPIPPPLVTEDLEGLMTEELDRLAIMPIEDRTALVAAQVGRCNIQAQTSQCPDKIQR